VRHKLLFWLLAFSLGVALLLPAASASPQGESRQGGTLMLMWGTEPDSLDPALANGQVGSWIILNATCAKLFTTVRDADTGKLRVVPEVVRRFARSNGGRTYTFELERTFRFHTGEPVSARSFAAAFKRNADPRMRSPVASRGFLEAIVGADAVLEGKAKSISGVRELGRYRLRIRLKRPTADFVARLTMPYFCPIPSGTPIGRPGIDLRAGSGPYYLAAHTPDRRIVLERNRHYSGGRTAYPDRIIWTIDGDSYARLRAVEKGKYDYMHLFGFFPDSVIRDLVDAYGLNRPGGRLFRSFPTSSNFTFWFNPNRPAFQGAGQAPLRKAINFALDRPAVVRAGDYLGLRPSDRLLPASLGERPPLYPRGAPDPVTARAWLARAGQRPQSLKLYTATYPSTVGAALVFAANLRQLDIEVDVDEFDLPTLNRKLATKGEPWDVAWRPVGAPYPDPAGTLVPLLRDPRWEARINAANRLTAVARARALADLEADLMLNDPPVAVYAHWTPLTFVSRSFGCTVPWVDLDLGAVCKK
jgi:ABC-type oligopeptide transport system substrate-binding subunit